MIIMQMSVEGQDGKRLCIDVDIDPNETYEIPLGRRIHVAMLKLLAEAVPSEPPPQITLVN